MIKNYKLSQYFSRGEIACHCCGRIGSYPAKLRTLLDMLDKLRDRVGKAIHVTCMYRCESHNRAVGGVENSLHRKDMAADIFVLGMSVNDLADMARKIGFGGIGRYYEQGFVHVDIGPACDWSE